MARRTYNTARTYAAQGRQPILSQQAGCQAAAFHYGRAPPESTFMETCPLIPHGINQTTRESVGPRANVVTLLCKFSKGSTHKTSPSWFLLELSTGTRDLKGQSQVILKSQHRYTFLQAAEGTGSAQGRQQELADSGSQASNTSTE